MSSPRWQAENGAEPRAGVGAIASQVLVSKQAHPDEGDSTFLKNCLFGFDPLTF